MLDSLDINKNIVNINYNGDIWNEYKNHTVDNICRKMQTTNSMCMIHRFRIIQLLQLYQLQSYFNEYGDHQATGLFHFMCDFWQLLATNW